MLDHTKPYVEKIHYVDAKLAGHVHKLDVKLHRLCGGAFLCLMCACLPSRTIDQQHFAKTKMGYISLPSNLNAIMIGCV